MKTAQALAAARDSQLNALLEIFNRADSAKIVSLNTINASIASLMEEYQKDLEMTRTVLLATASTPSTATAASTATASTPASAAFSTATLPYLLLWSKANMKKEEVIADFSAYEPYKVVGIKDNIYVIVFTTLEGYKAANNALVAGSKAKYTSVL